MLIYQYYCTLMCFMSSPFLGFLVFCFYQYLFAMYVLHFLLLFYRITLWAPFFYYLYSVPLDD